ncbi:MAG: hypothetical protein V3W51_01070 [Candidatus Brocadiales bacterium]
MKKLFVAACSVVPVWVMLLMIPPLHDVAGHMVTKEKLVTVSKASVEKVKDNRFRITARGFVGSPGWVVNLHPKIHDEPPRTWVIDAVGILRPGFWIQVVTEWQSSAELNLPPETREVSVRGLGENGGIETITMSVPWGD